MTVNAKFSMERNGSIRNLAVQPQFRIQTTLMVFLLNIIVNLLFPFVLERYIRWALGNASVFIKRTIIVCQIMWNMPNAKCAKQLFAQIPLCFVITMAIAIAFFDGVNRRTQILFNKAMYKSMYKSDTHCENTTISHVATPFSLSIIQIECVLM